VKNKFLFELLEDNSKEPIRFMRIFRNILLCGVIRRKIYALGNHRSCMNCIDSKIKCITWMEIKTFFTSS